MRSAARDYVARHKVGVDPQWQLELDMMSGEFFDDEDEPMEEFSVLDLQAEIDALKSDGLFSGNSPDKDSQTSEDLSEDSDEEEAPRPQPQPTKKQQPKQKRTKRDVESVSCVLGGASFHGP